MGCSQSSATNVKVITRELPNGRDLYMPAKLKPELKLSGDDYKVIKYIAEGGMGVVYSANQLSSSTTVALKFFGYNERPVILDDIHREIELLSAVSDVRGLVDFYGVFADSKSGYAEYKVDCKAYPVICMELLEGGDMFERIQMRKTVSEKYIASIFRDVIIALDGLHKKGYIHRDLKPENLMLVSHAEDSRVKLIDFGMMVNIPETGVYKSKGVQGTRGFVAPESLKNAEYSSKSDFWQAGCTLYALLSGLPAFSPHRLEQTIAAEYFKMVGVGWENISDSAKELVASILTKDPASRPTAEEMLSHPWVSGGAPDTDMGEAYYKRIKSLALKHKMKTFFQDHETLMANKLRKAKLRAVLPFLRPGSKRNSITLGRRVSADSFRMPSAVDSIRLRKRSNSMDLGDLPPPGESTGGFHSDYAIIQEEGASTVSCVTDSVKEGSTRTDENSDDFQENLDKLSSLVVSSMAKKNLAGADNTAQSGISIDEQLNSMANGHIDYDTFVAAMIDCELPELACRCVFNIFDIDKTGTVDLKDFLVTMVAFRDAAAETSEEALSQPGVSPERRRSSSHHPSSPRRGSVANGVVEDTECKVEEEDDPDSIVRFYFNMFDVNHTGVIDQEELKLAVSCLFADEQQKLAAAGKLDTSSPHFQVSVPDIQALFEAIDTGKTGTIDYEEFKAFYNTVLITSTTRNDRSGFGSHSFTSGTIGSGPKSREFIIVPESIVVTNELKVAM